MMKTLTLALLSLALPLAAALADDAPKPDYSEKALLQFTKEFLRQEQAERVDFHIGSIDIYHFGMRARFYWLPLLAPLPGTRLNEVAKFPDPFALTNTRIARSMPYMGDEERPAAVSREIRRVLKLEKRAKVKVQQ
jgi:hypothetical protein